MDIRVCYVNKRFLVSDNGIWGILLIRCRHIFILVKFISLSFVKYATVHLKNQFTTIMKVLPKIKGLPKFTLANNLIIKPDTDRNVSWILCHVSTFTNPVGVYFRVMMMVQLMSDKSCLKARSLGLNTYTYT